MTIPLFLLSILSVTVGFLTKEFFIGFGTDFWATSIFVLPRNYTLVDIEFINLFSKLLPLLLTLLGAFFAYNLYIFNIDSYFSIKHNFLFKLIFNFLNKKWYFDRIYNQFITTNVLYYSYFFSYRDLDRGIIEVVGPSGVIGNVNLLKKKIEVLQSGHVYHYLFLILTLCFTILLTVLFVPYYSFLIILLILFIFYYVF
jgi:NADH-ubiquinone oxidoreductase chain 5